jgi:hypothetical protein
MARLNIVKTGPGKFTLTWLDTLESPLALDFNPLLTNLEIGKSRVCLVHWQARPKGLRQFGIFDCYQDQYFSGTSDRFLFLRLALELREIDETKVSTIPTAVILLHGTVHQRGTDAWIIV